MTLYSVQAGATVAVREGVSSMHETWRGSYTKTKIQGHLSPSQRLGSGCTLLSREAAVLRVVHSRSFRNAHGQGSYAECGHHSAFLETTCPYSRWVPKRFSKPPEQLKEDKKGWGIERQERLTMARETTWRWRGKPPSPFRFGDLRADFLLNVSLPLLHTFLPAHVLFMRPFGPHSDCCPIDHILSFTLTEVPFALLGWLISVVSLVLWDSASAIALRPFC